MTGMIQSGRFAAASVDPDFASVVMLLGFDGVNGATSTVDESTSGKSITFNGGAQLSTAQLKFGTASLYTDGVGDYITSPDSADWFFGSAPWTVEGFYRFDGTPTTNAGFVAQWDGTALNSCFGIFKQGSDLVGGYYNGAAGFSSVQAAWSPSAGTWYHLAMDRDVLNILRLYIDGVCIANATRLPNVGNATALFQVGALIGHAGAYDFKGWSDEVRITKGVARYATNGSFTPPSAAFPRS